MKAPKLRLPHGQGGYTLVEVVIASSIGAMLMTGLTSVILTSVRATTTASSRVEASSQLRSIEFFARDDFARSHVPQACPSTPPATCLVLTGLQVRGSPASSVAPYQVTYSWDGSSFLDRQVGDGQPAHIAINVTAFSWYLRGSPPRVAAVLQLTITVGSYSESQSLLFYPQLQ